MAIPARKSRRNNMKLYIKQKVFAFSERFTVKDETGVDRFVVEGSFMRIPKKFIIRNEFGEMVSEIEKQMFRIFSRYDITTPTTDHVELVRRFSFFKSKFEITGKQWELRGDIWDHDYSVVYGDRPVMYLRKHWFTWGDSYELTIPDERDAVLALSIAIAIDKEIADDQQSN